MLSGQQDAEGEGIGKSGHESVPAVKVDIGEVGVQRGRVKGEGELTAGDLGLAFFKDEARHTDGVIDNRVVHPAGERAADDNWVHVNPMYQPAGHGRGHIQAWRVGRHHVEAVLAAGAPQDIAAGAGTCWRVLGAGHQLTAADLAVVPDPDGRCPAAGLAKSEAVFWGIEVANGVGPPVHYAAGAAGRSDGH